MAGTIVELGRATYDFSGLQSGQSQTTFVRRVIDISEYTEGTLEVRSLAHTLTGGSIVVEVRRTAPTTEDPKTRYIPRPSESLLASVTLSTTAPKLFVGAFAANPGSHVEVTVKGTMGVTPATLSGDLSILLSLKRGPNGEMGGRVSAEPSRASSRSGRVDTSSGGGRCGPCG